MEQTGLNEVQVHPREVTVVVWEATEWSSEPTAKPVRQASGASAEQALKQIGVEAEGVDAAMAKLAEVGLANASLYRYRDGQYTRGRYVAFPKSTDGRLHSPESGAGNSYPAAIEAAIAKERQLQQRGLQGTISYHERELAKWREKLAELG